METIVVGVDGSQGAEDALRYAIGEARLRHARLRIVSAWRVPAIAYAGAGGFAPTVEPELFEQSARDALERAVALVGASDGVELETVVGEGQAAAVLLEHAAEADLLVVGSRGRGGFAGLLLGSVSQQCVQHAPCPTTVVPPPKEREG